MKKETVTFNLNEYDKEIYKRMDSIVNKTIINIYSLTKNSKEIVISPDFDFNNKNHLYFLKVCLVVQRLYGKEVKIIGHFWETLLWNIKNNHLKIGHYSKKRGRDINPLNTQEILDFMQPALNETLPDGFDFWNIYDSYFNN